MVELLVSVYIYIYIKYHKNKHPFLTIYKFSTYIYIYKTGDRPNILFGWIQDEVLNKHPLYQALPHISRVNRTIGSRWLSQFEQHRAILSILEPNWSHQKPT